MAYKRDVKQPRQIEDLANAEKWAEENLHITESQTDLNLTEARQVITNLKMEIQKQADRLERLKADKDRFVLKAPRAGIVVHGNMTQRLALEKAPGGKELKAGDTVMPNQPILVIYLDEGYQVKAAIPEQARYLVKSDNPAQVYLRALPDKIFKANISEIADLPDGLSNQGPTFSAQLALEDTDKRLRPGLTCTIRFELDELTDVLVIPAGLIKVKQGQSFVNLLEEEKVVSREVVIGARRAEQVWVAAGLKEGDVIVLRK